MKILNEIIDEQGIKDILLSIKSTKEDFYIVIKNKSNVHCDGAYYRGTKRITLYLPNHNSINRLIYTAIHEYTHHLMDKWVGHKIEFWEKFFELLEIAERKGLYKCNINNNEKLKKITTIIKHNNLVKDKKISKKDLRIIFKIILKLCEEIDINFQYYTVKYLEMEWYKKKNASLAYTNLVLRYAAYGIDNDDFLHEFFNNYDTNKET